MKNKRIARWLVAGLFIAYVCLLFYCLLYSEWFGRTPSDDPNELRFNFELFHEIRRYWTYREQIGTLWVMMNLVGNVVLFMPLGILQYYLSDRTNVLTVLFVSLMTSLIVETLQLYYAIGSFDVDDLFLNTMGGVLGYLIWKFIEKRKQGQESDE